VHEEEIEAVDAVVVASTGRLLIDGCSTAFECQDR